MIRRARLVLPVVLGSVFAGGGACTSFTGEPEDAGAEDAAVENAALESGAGDGTTTADAGIVVDEVMNGLGTIVDIACGTPPEVFLGNEEGDLILVDTQAQTILRTVRPGGAIGSLALVSGKVAYTRPAQGFAHTLDVKADASPPGTSLASGMNQPRGIADIDDGAQIWVTTQGQLRQVAGGSTSRPISAPGYFLEFVDSTALVAQPSTGTISAYGVPSGNPLGALVGAGTIAGMTVVGGELIWSRSDTGDIWRVPSIAGTPRKLVAGQQGLRGICRRSTTNELYFGRADGSLARFVVPPP